MQTLQEFGEQYDQYFPKIYRFLYYRVNDKETAEDLTGHVFLKAVEKFHQFSPEKGTFSSWIYRIARNTLTDHYRKNKTTLDIDAILNLKSDDDTQSEVQKKMSAEELHESLKTLKPLQRDIIMMRLWDELPYAEIAEIIGKTEGNCKVIFSRAVKALQSEMATTTLLLSLLIPLTH